MVSKAIQKWLDDGDVQKSLLVMRSLSMTAKIPYSDQVTFSNLFS